MKKVIVFLIINLFLIQGIIAPKDTPSLGGSISAPFILVSFSVDTEGFTINLKNGAKNLVDIKSIAIEGCTTYDSTFSLDSLTSKKIDILCNDLKELNKFDKDVTITYRISDSTTDQIATGSLSGTVSIVEKENEISKTIGTIKLIYDENTPDILDTVFMGNLQMWLKGRDLKSILVKNSEINNKNLKNTVSVFIFNKKIIVIYGEDSTSLLVPIEAGNIYSYLLSEVKEGNIKSLCPIISSDEFSSDDLKDYLCEEGVEIKKEPKVIVPSNKTGPIKLPKEDHGFDTECSYFGGAMIENGKKGYENCKRLGYTGSCTIYRYIENKWFEELDCKGSSYDKESHTGIMSCINEMNTNYQFCKSPMEVTDGVESKSYISSYRDEVQCCKSTVSKKDYLCNGCELEDNCYPLGYRKEGNYCTDTHEFVEQNEEGVSCENSFECKSNVCVSGECISEGLIKKIINWFKRLFG